MVIIPDSDIFLLKCPLQIDNKNQLSFTDETAQYNYFQSLDKIELEEATYQRKDGVLRWNGNFEELIDYNYCMYKNTHYSNKWFYAFIDGMEYKNDNCTYIYLKTDVFQTWQFDLIYKKSFVEREMIDVANDIAGANLIPENLETGEFKIQGTASVSNLNPVYITAFSNQNFKIQPNPIGSILQFDLYGIGGVNANNINGIPSHVFYLCATSQTGFELLKRALDLENQSEYVVANFTVPYCAVNGILQSFSNQDITDLYVLGGKATATTETLIQTPSTIDGYTPRNQKLRQYPYLYIGFNPPMGTEKVFRYENFSNGTPSFKFISEVNPNPTVYVIPQNYRGASGDSLSDKVSLNGYPQLSSKINVYNSWLAENSGIINVETEKQSAMAQLNLIGGTSDIFNNLIGLISSAGQGNITSNSGVIGSAINLKKNALNYDFYIKNLMAQVERQQILPDNVALGGSNATLLGYELIDDNIFTRYSIKSQFAQRIDEYFDMYGYQTNSLKIPNINNRPNWNYIKTAGINLIGDIPEIDLQEIKSLFNEGFTIWHNTSTFLDYSQNNRTT